MSTVVSFAVGLGQRNRFIWSAALQQQAGASDSSASGQQLVDRAITIEPLAGVIRRLAQRYGCRVVRSNYLG